MTAPSLLGASAIFLVLTPSLQAQVTVLVGPNNPGTYAPIAEITLDDNGTPVTQTSSQPGGTLYNRSTPLSLTGVTLQGGLFLDIFNFEGAEIALGNFATVQPVGIGTLESDGTQVALNAGTAAFTAATETMLQSPNLNSYLYYDNVAPDPASGTADFETFFRFSFLPTDHILVQERYGNTFFELTALDINGDPISGANILRFGENGGAAYSVYDWNTGYASATYLTDQSYAFTIASISEFFDGSTATPQPVFGLRIDNDGEADVKFFGASNDTFLNNPYNPAIPGSAPVPEPAAGILALLALCGLGSRCRR